MLGSGVKLLVLLLHIQGIHGQGPGPGGTLTSGIKFEVKEELPSGTLVGSIPIKPGFTYRFNENVEEFVLNPTSGQISTSKIIDREKLLNDNFQLVALSSHPTYPIEISIKILDINDNAPVFPDPVVRVTFSESSTPGTRVFLDTAEDSDLGSNKVQNDYAIVNGNEYEHFQLSVSINPSGDAPFLYLETTGLLDRETKSNYKLNISASDRGIPRRVGYVLIDVNVLDINDNPPIFDHSDYVVSLNESVSIGSPVLQVTATDNDEGENARVSYYLADTETQFSVNPDTGSISTLRPSLSCQYNCPEQRSKCKSRSCVFTVFARDYGIPRQDGRTYVTVNLLDANDHDPVIKFRYFPETAQAATVDENAQNGSVVAAISALDLDEGLNGETTVRIFSGNELNHFRLESTPSFQLLRVNGILDRERFGKYNLTIIATDKGSPPRSSASFLLVEVNDINDHEPIFEQTEYTSILRELTPIGSYVTSFHASDEDTGINSKVYYSIISGNEYGWFLLDPESGLLTTRAVIDRETRDVVRLNVSARDGGPSPKWAFTSIKVTILDENDQAPAFPQPEINSSIPENTQPGTLITTLVAIDHDQGTNGSVSYHLTPEHDPVFHLDSANGQLVNKVKFDRETTPIYSIKVTARDKGSPPLSSTLTINLLISDLNDNDPTFYPVEYFVSLSKNTPITSQVTRVHASDPDEGENAKLHYILNSPIFKIDKFSGVITLAQSIASKNVDAFTLMVEVEDGGGRKSRQNAKIYIVVTETANTSVVPKVFEFAITENYGDDNNENREVGMVLVENAKKFSVLDGDSNYIFAIRENGVIYTQKAVDRELTTFYNLSVLITKTEGYELCGVNIAIQDLNDNTPIFIHNQQEIEIDENAAIGSDLLQVLAFDADAGENSTIKYSFSKNPNGVFSVDPNSGLVTLHKNLKEIDLNKSNHVGTLEFEIQAEDNGIRPLVSYKMFKVKVRDVNDHNPVFEKLSYETSILESTPLNSRFYFVRATDSDLGRNAQINYEIAEGNEREKFGIFPDGSLYVRKFLDREMEDYYALSIVARDNGAPQRSSSVPFVINIIDENDNAPVFTNSTFTFSMSENEESGTFVGKLSASDVDIGRNSELTYYISGAQTNFSMDPRSGYLRSLKPFDREELIASTGQDFCTIEVIVKDNGNPRLSDAATVRVYVEDENDNPPQFSQKTYAASISEGSPVGSHVIRVYATDSDSGLNADILYFLTNANSDEPLYFKIDPSNGQISIAKLLDKETISTYTLQVVAHDLAEYDSSLSATVTVTIEVTDENDNAPEFAQSEHFISISEMESVGKELMKFETTDPDTGLNSIVTYSITGGNNKHEVFRIDPVTGALYLNKGLDFEKRSTYTLNITATDSGSPKLSSYIEFSVKVQDYNDNAPIFPSTAIFRQIVENIPINSTIVTISAEDADAGLNGKILYSISDQDPPGDYFGIDPELGRIYNRREIDREVTESFRLIITATDQAIPISLRLSAEKLVTVIVEDINDNEPHFTSMNAAIYVKGSKSGTEITKVQALDPDSESNGLVTYEITNGDTSIFTLDRNTGSLKLHNSVAQPQPRYQLTIKSSDEATQSNRKSSELYLTLIGVDNSKTGAFMLKCNSNGKRKSSVYENEPIGSSVLRLKCESSDSGEIEYYITNITSTRSGKQTERLFDIDVKRGIVVTSKVLDRETDGSELTIDIYAILLSPSGLYATNTAVEVEILDRNDSPPAFKERKINLNISESAPVNYRVATIIATDDDTVGNVSYSILNDDGHFSLDESMGVLRILEPLDREEMDNIQLTVQASDGIQNSEMKFNINVLDENDNPPIFLNNGVFSFDIPENAPVGYPIVGLKSVDPDSGLNGVVTYSVLSDWGNDVFALNPETGVFTLASRLDYEDVQHYVFLVQAQDSGLPRLSSTATVYLNILDLNDNSPLFDPMSYSKELLEDIAVGSSVLTLSATDSDSGPNGEIRYEILSGNQDGCFEISDNGTIFTKKELDRETTSTYTLLVRAFDLGQPKSLSSTSQVSITLRDVNDESPMFISPNETSFMENQPVNTLVASVKAVDKDEGRNGYVEYILNNERPVFTLGPVDGLLRVNRILDREAKQNYTLSITAKDKGEPSRSSMQSLLIRIQDTNDKSPTFNPRQYSAIIMENASVGMMVFQVTATDLDEGVNGAIRYSIQSGDHNQDFMIGEDTGVVRVAKNLNFEREHSYVLTIKAEDSGNDVRFDTVSGVITITNTNDNSPMFMDSPYIVYVRENMENASLNVLRLNAVDADGGPSNQIKYLLTDGDKGTFRVHSSSGELTVHRKLDREKQSEYLLTVIAMDSGSPRLTGTGTIKVFVTDVNDNSPVFEHDRYEVMVQAQTTPGTLISRVLATDADEGDNAKIKYTLIGESPFSVEEDSGEIRINSNIGNEKMKVYNLRIKAQDFNSVTPLSTLANLTIRIENQKNIVPIFRGFKEPKEQKVTIPEQNKPGTFVFGLSSEDTLSGIGTRYYLGGPDGDKFQINQETGVVTTLKTIKSTSQFEIYGNDALSNQATTPSSILVTVELAELKNFPTLSSPRTSFTIPENTRNITLVKVESGSRGVVYSIGGGNIADAFEINKLTGEVRVSPLGVDYEVCQSYYLWILARRVAHPNLAVSLILHINITDINDNEPVFEKSFYELNVLEEEYGPTSMATLVATDADDGKNGKFQYRFAHESMQLYGQLFSIEPESGRMYSNAKLDREKKSEYELTVEAFDFGNPQLTGTTAVTIRVEDKNDNPPRFTRLFSVNVTENVPIGHFVIQVTSIDKDVGRNANSTYIFTEAAENAENPFSIDAVSGNVTVSGVLDREVQDEYLIRVAAVDGFWRAETLVSITVQDINDNAPEFDHSYYNFNVPESKYHVKVVGQVTATDRDKRGPNSAVTYTLKTTSEFFTVDPLSGEIYTKKPLVYKANRRKNSAENEHILLFSASDSGKPQLSSETTVCINVIDAKNTQPIFFKSKMQAAVLEEAQVGQQVIQVHAVDKDTGFNAHLDYIISGGNGSKIFALDKNTGSIYVNTDMRGKRSLAYTLNIVAIDKGIPPLSARASLTITVTGPNVHPPVFSSVNYRVIVPENEAIGTTIVTVTATDLDSGPNGQLTYNITHGNKNGYFEINPSTGGISVHRSLDYETRNEFNLSITASDLASRPKQATAQLTIHLTDINDNAPFFPTSKYVANILENSLPGTSVTTLRAIDRDSPKHGQILYVLAGGDKNAFMVNSTTGVVVSTRTFDYEDRNEYELDLAATNPDSNLFGTAQLLIKIVGANEFIPRFVQPSFQFSVSESAPIGSRVGQLEATDEDSGPDGVVYFYFLRFSNNFRIVANTGEVQVARRLDRESQSRVVLSVLAKNFGSIRGNDVDEAQVVITITDGNDPPVFEKDVYTVEVVEGLAPGSKVLRVKAKDSDVRPINSRFTYDILNGNANASFRIDPINGDITTSGEINREHLSTYELTVGAVDTGEPPQTGTTIVKINVADINDNGPQLVKGSMHGRILENEPTGTIVMTLRASDPDSSSNGPPFTYSIAGGSEASYFELDSKSGVLKSLVPFDREKIENIALLIEIRDSGTPPLKTRQEVEIQVDDVNDNPSSSRNARIVLYIFNNQIPTRNVGVVQPLDPDTHGNYNCKLETPSTFFKVEQNCHLYIQALPKSDVEVLKVSGDDGRHMVVASTFTVDTIMLDNVSLANAILLRVLGGKSPEQILEFSYEKLTTFLQQHLHSNVKIYSILAAPDGTDLVLHADSQNVKEVVSFLQNHKNSIERILRAPVIINYRPCANLCQNQAVDCEFELKVEPHQDIVESPELILSSRKLKVEVQCTCAREFEGTFCEYRKEPCSPNPCYGGVSCSKVEHDFECACESNRAGKRCETQQINVCDSNPCQNGGSCRTDTGSIAMYFCLCRPGFLGSNCQIFNTDSCSPNPCLNGGECITSGSSSQSLKCNCKGHYYGKRCEKRGFGFSYASYMTFPPLDPNTNDISILFATTNKNSLLIYNYGHETGGRSDFLSLELVNGKPRLSYGGSRSAIGKATVNKFIADGKWHKIVSIRNSRAITLSVANCEETGEVCEECKRGDTSCSVEDFGHTGTLNFNGNPMYLGGMKSVEPLLDRPEQVVSDDFIGCIHSVEINGRPLNLSSPIEFRGVSESCPRDPEICSRARHKCGNGECVDLWDSYACRCSNFIASNCEDASSAYSIKVGGSINFGIGEKYKRNIQLRKAGTKNGIDRKAVQASTISIKFRTTKADGVLLFAATNSEFTLLHLSNGWITFSSKAKSNYAINMTIPDLILSDGVWHNVEVVRNDVAVNLYIDGEKRGDDLTTELTHNFVDPKLTTMTIAGANSEIIEFYQLIPNFEGCIVNFTINGYIQPLNGSGILLDSIPSSVLVTQGCTHAVLASSAPDPLSIGVTLVIIFFVALLIAIFVSFVIFRVRKNEKSPLSTRPTSKSPPATNLLPTADSDTTRSFVRNAKKMSESPTTGYHKPDIIERNPGSLPTHSSPPLRRNTISLEPDLSEQIPEHYDLDTASSIAPSDIDIVYHYKGYRENNTSIAAHPKKNSNFPHSHHFPMGRGIRQSPISHVLKSTPLARLSPSSELSHQTTPRILTLQDISGKSYSSALLHPEDALSQSEHSVSSTRSSLAHNSRQGPRRTKPGSKASSNLSIGLTAEEVERLNGARHKSNSSFVSTLDAVSSSDDDKNGHGKKRKNRGHNLSSEDSESENDSFSCSEFEYENKEPRTEYPQRRQPLPRPHKLFPSEQEPEGSFQGSLSTLVASDDDIGFMKQYNRNRVAQYPPPVRPNEEYV